jgi:hypothetical protein
MNSVKEARHTLSLSTKRGLPLILAGLLFWLVAGLSGFILPEKVVVWVYIFGVGVVFPLGILIAAILKIDIFAKGNPLGLLSGTIGGMQILFGPIIIMLYFESPQWIPFALGVLNGAHFLPYAWIYNSKTYLIHSIMTTVVAAGVGVAFLGSTFIVTPLAIAVIFVICIFGLLSESKRDMAIPINETTSF